VRTNKRAAGVRSDSWRAGPRGSEILQTENENQRMQRGIHELVNLTVLCPLARRDATMTVPRQTKGRSESRPLVSTKVRLCYANVTPQRPSSDHPWWASPALA
jgi:hypothetical protein